MDIHSDPLLAPLEHTPEGVRAGDCVLFEKLGQGGMGAVYLAHHLTLDIDVAVKVLPFHAAAVDKTAVSRFQKEARSTVRVDHPNVVRVFHAGQDRGVHYLVMEFVDGESADARLKREGPLPERDALEIAVATGEALAASHAKGILHRDVKPANIMIRFEDGRVKLADLGLAKAFGGERGETAGLTATGQMLGTPAYMSPEQVGDASRAGARADVYSLGATLYALLSGGAPFEATQLYALLKKVEQEEPKDLRSLRPELTEKAARAVKDLMAKDPAYRPRGMAEAVALLRGCLDAARSEGARGLARPEMAGGRKPGTTVEERRPAPEPEKTLDDVTPGKLQRERGVERAAGRGAGRRATGRTEGTADAAPTGRARPGAMPTGRWLAAGLILLAGAVAAVVLYARGPAEEEEAVGAGAALPEPAATISVDLGGGVEMEMVYARPGRFTMGSDEGKSDEGPAHEVVITKGFYLGECEVTQEQYERVTGKTPSRFKGAGRPVESVSWDDAVEFCRRLNSLLGTRKGPSRVPTTFRLPTEAEWEYAARAGSANTYCFGGEGERLGDYAWCRANSDGRTHPAGEKRPNAWGIHDVHGNVWEWCADPYGSGYYGESPRADPTGPAGGSCRVLRGGSWVNDPEECRSASRCWGDPADRYSNFGFRVAAVVAEGP